MTEQELRALVRQAIARHAGGAPGSGGRVLPDPINDDGGRAWSGAPRAHASHAMFVVASGADADGPCIIEPTVACNHCGYCQSMGH
jgi:hypothetical protein